ncbi:MAG: glycosyltransferase, partial [Alistipes sp.]|nr:glycosyltransferase [Alistipes sp.]
IIFSLGRLVEYKGFEHLIEAARYLGDEYVILIGGSGPLKETLQAEIDRLGLNERVKLLGFLRDQDLPAYYEACDLFCLSSVFKTEAFGIVQIEAMSYGKPVVATTIEGSGVHWVNAEGVSGLNARKGDAQALAQAIQAITSHPLVYERYTEGARKRFQEMFTLQHMIDNTLAIYTKHNA